MKRSRKTRPLRCGKQDAGASVAVSAPQLPSAVIEMDIDLVRPYPGNDTINPPCSDEAERQFRRSLAEEGQRDPIQLLGPENAAGLPGWTNLDGHRRVAGLRANGETTVKAVIRRDLQHADRDAVHAAFLGLNRDRRQLDALALANNLREQMEAERHRPRYGLTPDEKVTLARTLAKLLETHPRNAARYAHGAHAPEVVQAAHRRGLLGLDDLARVGMTAADAKEDVAEEIATLANPDKARVTEIVRRHVAGRPTNRVKRYTPVALKLVRHLEQDLAELGGRYDKLFGPDLAPHRESLRRAKMAIELLIQVCDRPGSSVAELFEEAGED